MTRRVWIDVANSPHVPLFEPVVERLRADGTDVLLTARDHAQTVPLAQRAWPDVRVVGAESPPGRAGKAAALASRAVALRRFARHERPDVALSHGSYAQAVAARAAGVPVVTMMDYEHQPANHLSFRLASRVVVPDFFPEQALRRFGAGPRKVVRYRGFKEQLYLARLEPDPGVLAELDLDPAQVIVVFRPPPEGALYHRGLAGRFDELLDLALATDGVQAVVLPRFRDQQARYAAMPGVRVPDRPVHAPSLLALADLTIGGGGTMTRESALLGTPTATVFAGRLAAVDAELIRLGRILDLRTGSVPELRKKPPRDPLADQAAASAILDVVLRALKG